MEGTAFMATPTRRPAVTTPSTARGRRTRAALVQAGRELFEERGFAETSINEVVTRADVAHGPLYVYFDSKESLLREVAYAAIGEVFTASLIGADVPSDPYARIEAANL